jgi:phage baseplate assembly protein W
MANGLSVALPLMIDPIFGAYNLNTNFNQLAKQNLKMLMLTNPGERMMDTNFGVGIRQYLFEPNTDFIFTEIERRVHQQVKSYLPYIGIDKVEFVQSPVSTELDPHYLGIIIMFTILPLQQTAILQINADNN